MTAEAAAKRGIVPQPEDFPFAPSSLGFDPSRPLDGSTVKPGERVLPQFAQQAEDSRIPDDVLPDMANKTKEELDYEKYLSVREKWIDDIRKKGLDEEQLDAFRDCYTDILHKASGAPPTVVPTMSGGAYYSPSDNSITIEKGSRKWSGMAPAIRHEMGHFFDEWVVNGGAYVRGYAAQKAGDLAGAKMQKDEAEGRRAEWISACFLDKKHFSEYVKKEFGASTFLEVTRSIGSNREKLAMEITSFSPSSMNMQERHSAIGALDTIGEIFEGAINAAMGHDREYYRKIQKRET